MEHRFPEDRGLTARMAITLILLGAVYAGFIAVMVGLHVLSLAVVVVIALGLLAAQYWWSDRVALAAMGARVVSPGEAPELHAVIDRLCAVADMDKPRVALARTDLPNAFATGRSRRAAVLCVTTGLVRRLDTQELEGVLAHELSHIAHRDVLVMAMAGFLGMVAGIMVRISIIGRGSGNGYMAMAWGVAMGVALCSYALSFLLVRVLSRYRELSADRAAAVATARPAALAAALTKVSGELAAVPSRDLRRAEPVSALLFAPAAPRASMSRLFAAHPSLERRLRQLQALEAHLGQAS
ncbi:MAG TPA: zinc metalloprotease HtpX [Acidimicrobiales bacterium]|nr:zinc metalloprotease HtpX [Acidimicrobiales bacterium]